MFVKIRCLNCGVERMAYFSISGTGKFCSEKCHTEYSLKIALTEIKRLRKINFYYKSVLNSYNLPFDIDYIGGL
jgi:hypothetical protein